MDFEIENLTRVQKLYLGDCSIVSSEYSFEMNFQGSNKIEVTFGDYNEVNIVMTNTYWGSQECVNLDTLVSKVQNKDFDIPFDINELVSFIEKQISNIRSSFPLTG